MTDEAKYARRFFMQELSELIDKHSKNDRNVSGMLEMFIMDILCFIDGCNDTEHPIFLSIGAYEKDVLSGDLHQYFQKYREFFAPIVRSRKQKSLMKRLH
jgi:hypothetical protein